MGINWIPQKDAILTHSPAPWLVSFTGFPEMKNFERFL